MQQFAETSNLALFTTNLAPVTQEAVATPRVVVTPSKTSLPPGQAKSTVSPSANLRVVSPAAAGYTKRSPFMINGVGVAPLNGLISQATAAKPV